MIDHPGFSVSDFGRGKASCATALAAGSRHDSPSRLRPHYHAHYYGAFVFDPDGHSIEAVCHEADPAGDHP